jgi:hypothetical protein
LNVVVTYQTPAGIKRIFRMETGMLNSTGPTSGTGTAYPSGAPEFTPGFMGIRATRSLVYM